MGFQHRRTIMNRVRTRIPIHIPKFWYFQGPVSYDTLRVSPNPRKPRGTFLEDRRHQIPTKRVAYVSKLRPTPYNNNILRHGRAEL